MATIKDVAKKAKVAVSTASLALHHDKRVKEETRQRVLEAAQELQYRPNGIARDLKTRKTETICVLLHDLGGPFYSELLQGVQDVAAENGYNTIASGSTGGKHGAGARLLLERRVDGVIVLAQDVDDEMILRAAGNDLPVVVLDRELISKNIFTVRVDNVHGGYEATKHLLDEGYRRIAFVSGPADSLDSDERYEGYLKAMGEYAVDESKRITYNGRFTEEGGYSVGRVIATNRQLPEAVFAANDEMAVGLLKAFQDKGIAVPEDVAVVGFDNIRISEYVRPALSTIKQPMYEMGAVSAQLLFQAMNNSLELEPVLLRTELVVRQSSRKGGRQ
ncbi:LacI family DNA-binding transcriptional regulator [Alicyclobacillus sp. SO9]|uniref:LacI family DNA-binding transcriptional regulator n=1 Tax=Alicyclobacillus sp. SO9 TaxID=2665646 RepID=UPI0018E7AD82|nr:LacI family DNA-binding transcriptional regulator [Alicyclobacillus sp. SO9]QQE79782.1 LacI family DNA-binding transcriptional regulator [Alicyclobacillus sp. SO9]